ncbi:hypothetical protein P691DRAFT_667474 [Macrolepiota fuliginosa MF-IS2]|uniref:HSF-type DNA-binding domain-containing protein n=1 Tax=Macrolepiota fuliginosa MF-IS2 TaxID=1400762 RepID=A0A9P5XEX2_9AGAR|nr:hypothetical protein P691DRAFT_667474 [Macrolepiota fuliginosa MF-IS2]
MATDNQLAISRGPRTSPQHVPKSARQTVPAFLQKLYEMVNDDKNQDLIRWSDAGDSFFVLDHERFAREVLGRWFKHQNFSSFVRQLNMYGFHKIPHLQQGVLRSDTDTEYWNFTHSNFRRSQPDLLCLIQRKKQQAQLASDESAVDVRDPHAPTTPTSPTLATPNQLDVQTILQNIAVITRHQTTISDQLNDLKRSNQMLWRESLEARGRLQKQQDTITRIIRFLAGVFGNHAAAAGHHRKEGDVVDASRGSHGTVVPHRRPTRFLIEDAERDPTGKVGIIEVQDPEGGRVYNTTYGMYFWFSVISGS